MLSFTLLARGGRPVAPRCHWQVPPAKRGARVARKPNYGFEKRQKEIAKQKKREEKAQKKAERLARGEPEEQDEALGEEQA